MHKTRTEDFIYLTLMASWLVVTLPPMTEPYDLIDVFGGFARVSRLGMARGYQCRAFDIGYDDPVPGVSPHSGRGNRSAFDLNGEAGLLFLGWLPPFVGI